MLFFAVLHLIPNLNLFYVIFQRRKNLQVLTYLESEGLKTKLESQHSSGSFSFQKVYLSNHKNAYPYVLTLHFVCLV